MDPFFLNQAPGGSRYSRSRPSSRASFNETSFQTLELAGDNDLTSIDQESVCSKSTSGQSSLHLSPTSQVPSTFISAPTPTPQLYSPHPLVSDSAVDPEWSLFASTEPPESHCIIVDPAGDMSILGVHYDSRFEAGSRPSSYPWPSDPLQNALSPKLTRAALNVGDMDDQYQNQHLGPMRDYGDPNNMAAFSTRSLSSSPPRSLFTSEQRELKRQRDAARRTNKNRIRREKSENGSYTTSLVNTPEMIPGGLVNYSNSVPPLSLAAEVPSNVSPQGYIAPYQASYPDSMRSNSGHDMYTSDYAIPASSYPVEHYQLHYDASTSDSSQSVYPNRRPTPLSATSEVPSLYQSSRTSQGSPIQSVNVNHLQNQGQHPHGRNLSTEPVRVVQSRPKPQCWEHGCNGRQFSTFSNLLRHQREKSGVASKSMCPKCGAEFTRTTARNGHMAHEKCKSRNE